MPVIYHARGFTEIIFFRSYRLAATSKHSGRINNSSSIILTLPSFLYKRRIATNMRKLLLTCLAVLLLKLVWGQEVQRQVKAVRTNLPIKIDGDLSDAAWKDASLLGNLVEMRPSFGKPEAEKNKSEFYLLYDDVAIYFGGMLHELSRDSISKELAGRDMIGINDFAGIIFDTYQDRINGLGFFITPLGEQADIKYSLNNEDDSWNTVYQSEARITDKGWSFEMKIPYSAIRFSKKEVQDWNIHILRRRSKTGQQYSWSPIDPTKFGLMNQAGSLTQLSNIQPPLRLSFSPYFSTYMTHDPGRGTRTSVNGGMDVKYGITDGFTMDMTLVPDFGQVQSDNQVLNLTPFEVRFNENRSFFNEGTELFNKGNLFYSRRIGGQPIHYGDIRNGLSANDLLIKNPSDTKLINATKVSGRTSKKLGIGIFNALTQPQHAIIQKNNGEQYKAETNPLTNYNVLVLDQALKYNSSVTLVNTNVWRSGADYDANVTALLWDIYDKNVDWNIWGQLTQSRLTGYEKPGSSSTGWYYRMNIGKFKGRFNFDLHRFYADKKYDQRDMGYFTNNNYLLHGFYLGYKWIKPAHFYNNIYLNLNGDYSEMATPRKYQYARFELYLSSQLKNLWTTNIQSEYTAASQDFYEPRISGKMVKLPSLWMRGFGVNTNSAKRYSASIRLSETISGKYSLHGTDLYISNNYRFSDRLSIGLSSSLEFYNNSFGFATLTAAGDSAVFGLRNRRTAENIFNVKYNFTNKMGITFRLRHYWSKVYYTRFFDLKDDGNVQERTSVTQNPDINVNLFNIDMNYSWQFAPGSFINVTWKTASELYNQLVRAKYYQNLRNTFDTPQLSNFSIKIIYFLDSQMLRKKK